MQHINPSAGTVSSAPTVPASTHCAEEHPSLVAGLFLTWSSPGLVLGGVMCALWGLAGPWADLGIAPSLRPYHPSQDRALEALTPWPPVLPLLGCPPHCSRM